MPGDATRCLASMGNYVFNTKTLIDIVTPAGEDDQYTDIGGAHHPRAHRCRRGACVRLLQEHRARPGRAREGLLARRRHASTRTSTRTWTCSRRVPVFNLYNDQWPVFTSHAAAAAGEGVAWCRRRAVVRRRQPVVRGLDRLGRPRRAFDRVARRASCITMRDVTDSILFPGVRIGAGAQRQPVHHRQERAGAARHSHRLRPARPTPSGSPSATTASW